jgi:di/tricarboxylate transporter
MVIFLLAGMFPLGTAMEKSGLDRLIAVGISQVATSLGPAAVVPVMFAGASILTSFISNAACAILLSPLALAAATQLHVSPWPLLMSVMFGSSMAFATPVGYQTNLMVYGAGGYRFMDFVRVGLPLTILFWIVGSLLIPVFWPLTP